MKKKVRIAVNHDGPVFLDTDIDELEKELGIDDMVIEEKGKWPEYYIYAWIDSNDYNNGGV